MAFHLQRVSLDWALKHVERHGDTDIFPIPFEIEAIRHCWDAGLGYGEIKARGLGEILRATDLSSWSVRPYRRGLSPKSSLGFRIATQLDPLDAVLLAALVHELGPDIEASRIPVSKGIVHSYRFRPSANGDMFDNRYGYRTFLQSATQKANKATIQWVVMTDIADFYPRIYSHPLQNVLRAVTGKNGHVEALLNFLSQINQSVSYGLPVGPSSSRLLAELTLGDVDQLLRSEGVEFIRFVDDYRIFCRTERQAYNALGILANALFEAHGLTLQQQKTKILSKQDYLASIAPDDEDLERARLSSEFEKIVEDLGLDNLYEPIDYHGLDQDTRAKVDELNLLGILNEQIELGPNASPLTMKFVLRRLAQLGLGDGLDDLLNSPRGLYLVLKEFCDYVVSLAEDGRRRSKVGRKILGLLQDPAIGHLAINRTWLLDCFARDPTLNCSADFVGMLNQYTGHFERRELILALGSHGAYQWLQRQKRSINEESPWSRRALIAAAKCLPGDEAPHWYKSLRPQLDHLEHAVAIWAGH